MNTNEMFLISQLEITKQQCQEFFEFDNVDVQYVNVLTAPEGRYFPNDLKIRIKYNTEYSVFRHQWIMAHEHAHATQSKVCGSRLETVTQPVSILDQWIEAYYKDIYPYQPLEKDAEYKAHEFMKHYYSEDYDTASFTDRPYAHIPHENLIKESIIYTAHVFKKYLEVTNQDYEICEQFNNCIILETRLHLQERGWSEKDIETCMKMAPAYINEQREYYRKQYLEQQEKERQVQEENTRKLEEEYTSWQDSTEN
jgi:hypothetical protein